MLELNGIFLMTGNHWLISSNGKMKVFIYATAKIRSADWQYITCHSNSKTKWKVKLKILTSYILLLQMINTFRWLGLGYPSKEEDLIFLPSLLYTPPCIHAFIPGCSHLLPFKTLFVIIVISRIVILDCIS